jgi:hypothetical protein
MNSRPPVRRAQNHTTWENTPAQLLLPPPLASFESAGTQVSTLGVPLAGLGASPPSDRRLRVALRRVGPPSPGPLRVPLRAALAGFPFPVLVLVSCMISSFTCCGSCSPCGTFPVPAAGSVIAVRVGKDFGAALRAARAAYPGAGTGGRLRCPTRRGLRACCPPSSRANGLHYCGVLQRRRGDKPQEGSDEQRDVLAMSSGHRAVAAGHTGRRTARGSAECA